MGPRPEAAAGPGRDGGRAGRGDSQQRRHHGGRGRGTGPGGGRGGRGGRHPNQQQKREKDNKVKHQKQKPHSTNDNGSRRREDTRPQDRGSGPNENINGRPQTVDTVSTSNITTSASLGPSITDTINELASQMQLINNTIGNSLSSQQSAASSKRECPKCIETSATLGELQSQVHDAMKRVEKMNLTLTVLQTHANLVQKSLETLSSHVGGASSSMNGTGPIVAQGGHQSTETVQTPHNYAARTVQGGHQSMGTVQSQVPARSNAVATNSGSASASARGKSQQHDKEKKNAVQEQPSKSFREMMLERRNGSQKPITTIGMGSKTTTNTVPKIGTLDGLIMSCAPYLTGSPTEYLAWLRDDLDVDSIADLAEAVTECPELLVAGNGSVGMWQKRKFSDAVLAAAAAVSSSKDGVSTGMNGTQSSNDDDRSSEVEEDTGDASEAIDDRDWTCPVCTCINPKLFLVCSACGSAGENTAAAENAKYPVVSGSARTAESDEQAAVGSALPGSMSQAKNKKNVAVAAPKIGGIASALPAEAPSKPMAFQFGSALQENAASASTAPATLPYNVSSSLTSNKPSITGVSNQTKELQQAEDEKRQDENAKKQRKKAKQNKAAEFARQKEEEKSAAVADRQRRMEAKLEKQAAMALHEAEVRKQQKIEMASSSRSNVGSSTLAVGITTTSAYDTKLMSSRQLAAKNRMITPSGRKKKAIVVDRLSLYIKPSRKGKKVSPIFNLLQNESTVEEGRKLMILEVETQRCKNELADLVGQKAKLEKGIKMEEHIIERSQKEIKDEERKTQSKWGISRLASWFKDDEMMNTKLAELEDEEDEKRREKEKVVEKTTKATDGDVDEKDSDAEESNNAENSTHKEKNGAEASNKTTSEEKEKPPGFEELIGKCSEFLTGAPSEYAAWLRSEGIKTITDLGAAVIEEEAMLVSGSGDVGITPGSLQQFSSVVIDAVALSGKIETNVSPQSQEEREEMEKEAAKKMKLAQAIAKKKAKEEGRKRDEKRKGKRHNAVKEAKERIASLNKTIEVAQSSKEKQKLQLVGTVPPLEKKTKELQKLRADIVGIKGNDTEEDVNFHIDGTRDDRSYTFLMVAAQNDDFFTAKTCFDLGADVYATSPEGLTAIDFSFFFDHMHVTNLIVQNGGSLPQKQTEMWNNLASMVPQNAESSKSWHDTLKTAETAALPAETLMESPEACEESEDKRMPVLSQQESSMDFSCFESRLINTNINSDQVQRVVLLDQAVYNWCLSANQITRCNFVNVLEGLKPSTLRRPGVEATKIHRRAIIGATKTYEVLAARFEEGSKDEKVVLFTPFVAGEVQGVTSIGVLVWAVTPDSEASLYKTLVANTEFMRHKVELEDRFLAHKDGVLELGKDMHLLDLHSTSIWTTSTMGLYILNVDDGDLERIRNTGFSAKKRIVHSEDQVNKAIFRTSQEEANENEGILASERFDMSSLISGGAGTGKTLLIIRKVASEERSRHVLVVSRLPRLVNIIKTAVEEKRDDDVNNLSFTTYDDLVQLLVRRVVPDDVSQWKSFVQFDRVRFDCDDSNVSFSRKFVAGYLNTTERNHMANNMIEPLTLWNTIIVIKSQAKCASTKKPLSLDDYTSLPPSFGLTEEQRQLCYGIFLKYQDWLESKNYWDEIDRVHYVLTHGPSVFREEHFTPWADRVNRFGEMDLLNGEGEPLYPFFYDVVCADEAQDFTEIDLVLFAKMSSSIRSLFLSADPAQSVELGVKMREGTVNDVFHSLVKDGRQQVKDVLQYIDLRTNHRTHAQNLAIGQAIRRVLARSFKVPMSNELALINGKLPQTMVITKVSDLADKSIFCGGNIVFLAPDEKVHELRLQFNDLGLNNDLFGVREAKGLEFDACALLGFFEFIEECGSTEQWQNVMRWLSSSSSLTKTSSTGERVAGLMLVDCDYRLSAPNVSDEAMMLYTAMTRARNHLYLIEVRSAERGKKQSVRLADFAFRRLTDLGLARSVKSIDEGQIEMTPAQHKARGVLLVTQALNMSRNFKPIGSVKEKFMEAMGRFSAGKGNDKDLLDKCHKHLDAVTEKHNLMEYAKDKFLSHGEYSLEGRFDELRQFEQKASKFFSRYLCDSFLVEEVHNVRLLVEEVVDGTPYENHFKDVCNAIKRLEQAA
ncbi:hypothetical protein ACHAXR_011413 [Thalassiosira sp. AJA248-18]